MPELVRATEALAFDRDRQNHAEWGAGLSVTAFQRRERVLREGPWPRATWDPWFWVDGEEVLASCETYRMADGARTVFLLASVLTVPALRGRGFASAMLRALEGRVRAGSGSAIVLFSDVGAPIYERLGYVALPAVDRVWPADERVPTAGPWRLLTEVDLADAWPSTGAALHPGVDQLRWHLARSRTLAEATGRPALPTCGAVSDRGVMVWSDEGDELLVLGWTGDERLAEAAARAASAAGLARVRAWEAPSQPEVGERVPRRGGLPMVLSLDRGPSPTRVTRGVWV